MDILFQKAYVLNIKCLYPFILLLEFDYLLNILFVSSLVINFIVHYSPEVSSGSVVCLNLTNARLLRLCPRAWPLTLIARTVYGFVNHFG